jgi:phage FluMu protein Com
VDRQWREVRCAKCRRILYEIEPDSLRPMKGVRKICDRCNAVNVQIGKDERPSAAP